MNKVDCVVEALEEKYDEGKSEGISQGERDKSEEIAVNLLREGVFSLGKIAEITGLPISEVEALNDSQL
ncbi:hypothetical protein [Methanobrevibacter sp.]|uniref:hypothetical protein n=1 Tax=Methanobrevibacter sp. TaxID=66852 RepID=UPI0038903728